MMSVMTMIQKRHWGPLGLLVTMGLSAGLLGCSVEGTTLEESTVQRPSEIEEKLRQALDELGSDFRPRTEHVNDRGSPRFINRLVLEDSPYLQQHAFNPVDWYPWGEEAFEKAVRENKPIFLSIGYSTCHWCHVMERESFEDLQVAQVLNEHFVAIKVDREQRPDVDEVYMTAVMMLTGRGGWPMSSFLTPSGDSFFAGTYFPRDSFLNLIGQIQNAWIKQPDKIKAQANRIADAVRKVTTDQAEAGELSRDLPGKVVSRLWATFDAKFGGFGSAPKFPQESQLLLLLDLAYRQGNTQALEMASHTLDAMQMGGIYDQVGGGFHRYSTDHRWLVPHFEKMLYNQSQLARAYLRAGQLTGHEDYVRVARETLDYVLLEMQNESGGFYSATDADSEGEEGLFFVWRPAEIRKALPTDLAELALELFSVSEKGNFEGNNILFLSRGLEDFAREKKLSLVSLLEKRQRIREGLWQARESRIPPLRDDKVITAWNAMMITAFAEAGHALQEPRYLRAATEALDYLRRFNYSPGGDLYRISLHGKGSIPAVLDDYANLLEALITLYDVTGDRSHLREAITLAEKMDKLFWDEKEGGFFISASGSTDPLSIRPKSPEDGAIPSGNSVAARSLALLSGRTDRFTFRKQALRQLSSFSGRMKGRSSAFSYFLLGANVLWHGNVGLMEYGSEGVVKVEAIPMDNQEWTLRLSIAEGWHVNSEDPGPKDLIATKISAADGTINDVRYPLAETLKLSWSERPLRVWQGNVEIHLTYQPPEDPSPAVIWNLRLQACNEEKCLAPEDLSLEIPRVEVAG